MPLSWEPANRLILRNNVFAMATFTHRHSFLSSALTTFWQMTSAGVLGIWLAILATERFTSHNSTLLIANAGLCIVLFAVSAFVLIAALTLPLSSHEIRP